MATMADVARLANVSLSTVSYVLSGTRPISAPTAEKVRNAAQQLGYQRNVLARGLAGGRTKIVALALPVARVGFSATIFEFVSSASTAAAAAGYRLVLWPTPADDTAALEDLAKEGLVDGAIVMEVTLHDPRIALLRRAGLPYVMIGRTADPDLAHYVDIDFGATVRRALDILQGYGHSDIHLITHSRAALRGGYGPVVRVSDAFEELSHQRGLATQVHYCEESVPDGAAIARRITALPQPPTALVVMNEEASYGVVNELTRLGVGIPADISVLSIVSSRGVAQRTCPVLTTLEAPAAQLGAQSFAALVSLLDDPQGTGAGGALVPCFEAPGDSVGPANRRGRTASLSTSTSRGKAGQQ